MEALKDGEAIVQETLLWDVNKNMAVSMRSKEEAHDYRYFPDPDLVPLLVEEEMIESVGKRLPELPDQKKTRFVKEYGLPEYDADILTAARDLADYFEACAGKVKNPKTASNWVMGELTALLNAVGGTIEQSPVSPEKLAELIILIEDGVISGKIAKTVFLEMAETGSTPGDIVKEKGLVQVSDQSAIEPLIDRIIENHPGEVEKYRGGNTKLMGFFVGQVMKETKGKANPAIVNELLKKKL